MKPTVIHRYWIVEERFCSSPGTPSGETLETFDSEEAAIECAENLAEFNEGCYRVLEHVVSYGQVRTGRYVS